MTLQVSPTVASLTRARACCIGRTAGRVLAGRERWGRVLAVVSGTAYLVTDEDELFWLARPDLPAHTRAILAPFDERAVGAGMPVSAGRGGLRIADRLLIDGTRAAEWAPPPVAPDSVAPAGAIEARVRALGRWRGTSLPIAAIERACRAGDLAAVAVASRALIGLGAGLTPAGDDFVGGVLFALHEVRIARPGALRWAEAPVQELLDYARSQTNRLSYTMLADLAQGEAVEPLHDLVAAVLSGQDGDRVLVPARRLLGLGSTSGAEMLAGALTGLLLIAAGH